MGNGGVEMLLTSLTSLKEDKEIWKDPKHKLQNWAKLYGTQLGKNVIYKKFTDSKIFELPFINSMYSSDLKYFLNLKKFYWIKFFAETFCVFQYSIVERYVLNF